VADGDGVGEVFSVGAFFAERFEVDGDAERSAHFILATVTAADGGGFIVVDVHVWLEEYFDFLGFGNELGFIFEKWEDGDFNWGDAGFESHDFPDVLFTTFFGEVFFGVGFAEKSKESAVAAGGWLNDVGDEAFFGFGIMGIRIRYRRFSPNSERVRRPARRGREVFPVGYRFLRRN